MKLPDKMMIVDSNGMPTGVVDVDKLQSDAARLMYDYAAAAGNEDELKRVAWKWAVENDPDYFGYLCAGALSLMVRNILDPVLEIVDEVVPAIKIRAKLAESRDNAEVTLNK